MKKIIRPIHLLLLSLGIDVRGLSSVRYLPKYVRSYHGFKKAGGRVTDIYPVLSDFREQAGTARGHYFHQDLLVASFIHAANPVRHIDIGSRIDGFVAHVASFRRIEVMDIRKLQDTGHENIKFFQSDLMSSKAENEAIADSISCLHAIEHFGLGRYGDTLDPQGHIKGFNNIISMLKVGGTLYISFPIGRENAVHFNAHRIFHHHDIFNWAEERFKLELLRFDYVDDAGDLHKNVDCRNTDINLSYGCGIYSFRRIA